MLSSTNSSSEESRQVSGAGGGRGGGGSFGVVVDLLSNAVVTSNYFASSAAGPGGNGGDGAPGRLGSPGANGGPKVASSDGGSGGRGGDGGDGGNGGSGAGGHGGPAIAILDPVDRITGIGNRYLQAPLAALPGSNGFGNGASLQPGVRAFKFPASPGVLGNSLASVFDTVVAEPGSGAAFAVVPVTLSVLNHDPITLNYTLTGVDATAGSDFDATAGTVTFNPWTDTAFIPVPVFADVDVEAAEQFQVTLGGIGHLDANAVVTIVPNALFANSFE